MDLLDAVAEVAATAPDRTAVVAPDGRLAYGELAAAVEECAAGLAATGVGAEDVVAIDLGRTTAMVVAMLATWRAGAACLLLDPRWPEARTGLVLADAGARLLLAESERVEGPVRRIGLAALRQGASAPPQRLDQTLAYVIYTSGSTGVPKGVGVGWGSLMGYRDHVHGLLAGDGPRRVLLSAPMTFDASLRPLMALGGGHQLHLMGDVRELSWEEQIAQIRGEGIEVLSGVPSWYRGLVRGGLFQGPQPVRLAFVGGEPLDRELRRGLRSAGCEVVVQYGPTETTVAATGGRLDDEIGSLPPLGRPLPGAAVRVLAPDLEEAPAGTAGEVCIGGTGVARGYLGSPRLTAERFLPDPFGEPGARMFRSGDQARRERDGSLGFIGRLDDQVKVRGYRIEPGEIEARLRELPGVADAAVVLAPDRRAGDRLVAWLVPAAGASDLPTAARDRLREQLPDYMVPAVFTAVDRLPVTAGGKVDRRALALAEVPEVPPPADVLAPRSDLEARLVGMWREVLGVETVGVDDNFFDLGGFSLQALNLVGLIRRELNVRLRIRDFVQNATVAALAARIEAETA